MLTSLEFLNVGEVFPPESENERFHRYNDNLKLYKGEHNLVFKDAWQRIWREDQWAAIELIVNWYPRLSKLWADMLLSEPPNIKPLEHDNKLQQDALDRIIRENKLFIEAYKAVIDFSRYGDGIFKIKFNNGRAVIKANTPMVWYPVVKADEIGEYLAHALIFLVSEKEEGGSLFTGGAKTRVQKYRAEIHEVGKITTIDFTVRDGKIFSHDNTIAQPTKVNDFLVFPLCNMLTTDSSTGKDDYSDLDSIIAEIEVRLGQISRILDKHSDPALAGADTMLTVDPKTGLGYFDSSKKFYPLAPEDKPPQYIVWDAQLEANFKFLETLMEQLYILSETSPAAFGQLKAGLAESGSALRRLMMATIIKVQRIRLWLDPLLKDIIRVASELEVSNGKNDSVKIDGVSIEWQDGLPIDETELTTNEVQKKAAGLTSVKSSVKRLTGLEGKALDNELEEIAGDREAILPPMLNDPDADNKDDKDDKK